MNDGFREEIYIAAFERTIRRLWILCIILIILLAGTNAAWIYYESQFEDVTETQAVEQDIDSGDGNAVVNGIGDLNYGTDKATGEDNPEVSQKKDR